MKGNPSQTQSKIRAIISLAAGCLLWLGGCAGYYVIPDSMADEVDRSVSFISLQADTEAHLGDLIPLGGLVLNARNLKEGTELEVLELPLDRYDRPIGRLTDSGGRFLVLHPGYLETAVLEKRRLITVVGVVSGTKKRMIDEMEYNYPYLKASFIHIWPEPREYAGYPYYAYPYYPYPYWPRYYPWRPYGYNPWGPPVILVPKDRPNPKRRFDPGGSSTPPAPKGSKRQMN